MDHINIEEIITHAAQGSAEARDQFDRELPNCRLLFPVNTVADGKAQPGVKVFTMPDQAPFTWAISVVQEHPTVPAFTSKEKLEKFFSEKSEWEHRWMEDSARTLMQNLAESELTLSLNPLDQYGVSIPPAKMRKMLG